MPEIPTVSRTASLISAVDAVFADNGPLASAMTEFEPRPTQREMAAAVADLFERGGVLIAEAGTGTGKTLAYLVPAILSGHRVLVSTGTKNLQEQIYTKDIPLLRQSLGLRFTATCMKGRGNYLCLHRYASFRESGEACQQPIRQWIPLLDALATSSESGDRAELDELPEDLSFWGAIAASSENCIGTECPRYRDCFVTRVRQRAAESDVVIVNHHLLCADASVRQSAYGEVIPECAFAIVDEAHQLEEIATQYFGIAVSNFRLDDLVRDGQRCLSLEVLLDDPNELREAIERVRHWSHLFFSALTLSPALRGKAGEDRVRIEPQRLSDVSQEGAMLIGALEYLEATIQLMRPPAVQSESPPGARRHERRPARHGPEPTTGRTERGGNSETAELMRGHDGSAPLLEDLLGLARRAVDIREHLKFLLRANDPDYVYFLETRGRGVVLRAAPIDVSAIIREVLFERMQATVLTSATLTVDGSFEFLKSRLGVNAAQRAVAKRLPSEFDYAHQAILYLPRRMPDPRSPRFTEAAARQVVEILRRTRGRAFVLFTSYSALRSVRDFVEPVLDFPLFVQGTAPRSALLERFRSTSNAVLLATSSFWQGVDVMGEALSCVIINKLPFASPGDPITAARMEAVQLRGGSPFSEYQVPLAILALQQGLGRLIRHRHDRGVLAVLDPRLNTMAYGRRFLESLPPAPVTRELADIEAFFAVR